MYDVIIKNGVIVDGTGNDKYISDIGIIDDKIIKVDNLQNEDAKKVIDAKGKVVSPGFIDPHSHADMNLYINAENEAYLHQGITSFIGGNCGMSAAPIGEKRDINLWDLKFFKDEFTPKYYEQFLGEIDTEKAIRMYKEKKNIDIDFKTLEQYYEKLEEMKFTTNYYPLVGHNNLRNTIMGHGCNREATKEEIEKMKELLKQELEAGARGFTTGLDYPPGAYSSKEEVLELVEVLKEYDGIYASHIRGRKLFTTGEGGYFIEEGINEVNNIGKTHNIKMHVAHMNSDFEASYVKSLFDNSLNDGVDISFDVIGNTSGGAYTFIRLMNFFQPWYLAAGNIEQFMKNISDADYLNAMKKDMVSSRWYFSNEKTLPGLESIILIVECKDKSFENKTVAEIMEENDWNYQDALINIVKIDPYTKIKYGLTPTEKAKDYVREIFEHPNVMVSTDAFAANFNTEWCSDVFMQKLPHENNYCTYIKYLLQFAPNRIEDAIRKGTGYVAERFNIEGRGIINENNFADIIIIDTDNLNPNENIRDTRNKPDGIDYVIINGQIVVENNKYTGEKPGRVLRAKR